MLSTVPKWRPLRWNLSFVKRKKSHGLRSGEYGGCGNTEITLLTKNSFTEMAIWQHCRDAAFKCPHSLAGHDEPFFWVVDGLEIQIQHTTGHSDCQTLIRRHEIPHFGHIFVRFWRARSYTTRFVFHILTAIQKCFMPPKNPCPW